MNHDDLKHYKKIYLEASLPENEIEKSWDDLRHRLPEQEVPRKSYYPAAFMFASLLLFFFIGTVGVSQASRPGDVLYPVKVLSDRVAARITGDYHTKVEKRATEVIKEADRSPERLEEATEAYKESINQVKEEAKRDREDKPEIRKTLQKQEERLRNINASNAASQKLIGETVSETQKAREEVKGEQTENRGNREAERGNQPIKPAEQSQRKDNR